MPDPEKKDEGGKGAGGSEDWKPLSREETEALQRQLLNKSEEAKRLHDAQAKRDAEAKAKEEEEAKKRGEHERLLGERDKELAGYRDRVAKREQLDTEALEAMTKDWPDNRKALIAGATPEDRLAHARKLAAEFDQATPPPPPGPHGKRSPTSGMKGFASEMEFAQNDPKGYLDWKKENHK